MQGGEGGMSNPNIKPRAFTFEECSKGGKTVSIYRNLGHSLSKRVKCTPNCLYFEICPVCAMSYGSPERKCMMKEFPETVKKQFVNMFLSGEEGVISQIKTTLHNYMVDVEAYGTLHDKRDMVQTMLSFYDKVYNNPKKMVGKKEPLTITIRRVGMEPQTVLVNPREPMSVGTFIESADKDDRESLINSPVLDTILMNKPVPRPLYFEEIKIESNIEELLNDRDEMEE